MKQVSSTLDLVEDGATDARSLALLCALLSCYVASYRAPTKRTEEIGSLMSTMYEVSSMARFS